MSLVGNSEKRRRAGDADIKIFVEQLRHFFFNSVDADNNSGLITTAKFSVNLNKAEDFVIVFTNNAGFVERSVTTIVKLYPCQQ